MAGRKNLSKCETNLACYIKICMQAMWFCLKIVWKTTLPLGKPWYTCRPLLPHCATSSMSELVSRKTIKKNTFTWTHIDLVSTQSYRVSGLHNYVTLHLGKQLIKLILQHHLIFSHLALTFALPVSFFLTHFRQMRNMSPDCWANNGLMWTGAPPRITHL